jgi:hypothetical protein
MNTIMGMIITMVMIMLTGTIATTMTRLWYFRRSFAKIGARMKL